MHTQPPSVVHYFLILNCTYWHKHQPLSSQRVQLKVMGLNLNIDSGFRRNDGQRYYRHAGLDPASSIYPTVLISPHRKTVFAFSK
jgi:hypothetical protein